MLILSQEEDGERKGIMITIKLQNKILSSGEMTDTIFIDTPIQAGHMFKVMTQETMSSPGKLIARMTESICGLEPGACDRMSLGDYVVVSKALEPLLNAVLK